MRHHCIGASSKPLLWLQGNHCLPGCVCQKTPDSGGPIPHRLTAQFFWQLHVTGLKEVIWTRGAGEESFLMAAGLHNHTYWVAFSHGTQGSNPYYLFPWSPERRVYDLGSAASSVSQHVPPQGVGQFSKATSSRAEGSRWRQPPRGDPVAGSWLSGSIMGWMLSAQAPSTPALLTGECPQCGWSSPTRLASCCPGDSPSQHAATQWFLKFRKSKLRQM